jgi:hypothetical protein
VFVKGERGDKILKFDIFKFSGAWDKDLCSIPPYHNLSTVVGENV